MSGPVAGQLAERDARIAELERRLAAAADVLRLVAVTRADPAAAPGPDAILGGIAEAAARLCDADGVSLRLIEGDQLRLAAHRRGAEIPIPDERIPLSPGSPFGRAILDRRAVYVPDTSEAEAEFPSNAAFTRRTGAAAYSIAAIPLLLRGEPLGVLGVRRQPVRPFADLEVALLETFADQAVIAIENARLFSELQERLEEQTATSDVLRAISQAPTDLERVLDTIARAAARLCGAEDVQVQRLVDGRLSRGGGAGEHPLPRANPVRSIPLSRDSSSGRAVLDRVVVHVPDAEALPPGELPFHRELARRFGHRASLVVPLLRESEPIGVILIRRRAPGAFTERQIALLETFADQAVIAIENARLFSELRERTDQLTRSVERLTALFEVSQAISSSLDIGAVLDAVIARAVELAGADGGSIYEYEPATETFRLRAGAGVLATALADRVREQPIRLASPIIGRAARDRAPVEIADLTATDVGPESVLDALIGAGFRSLVALPLLHEERIVGALAIRRRAVGNLPGETLDLLRTFANQAALAIQNARLFQALAEKSAQLEEASRHKSEFLANMSHELRTPLNAIIGFTEVLLEKYFGEVNEKQEDYLKDVLSSGQHLLALINDILDLSKVEAGRMELEPTTFALGPVLESGLVMVKERASRRGIQLGLELDPEIGRLEADERKVKQVVFNLLSNAVKFTPDGGRVDVYAWRENGFAHVAVKDTGVGIAADDQTRIFEEFQQARGQASGKVEGTGLGLTLTRRFVELHGGSIRVESEVGKGSTFTVSLPVEARWPAS